MNENISTLSGRNPFDPHKGNTLAGEIACYGLPYGLFGFISHLFTYYTVICLSLGRRPLWPWRPLTHANRDLWIALVGMIGGVGLATFTIVRCRNHWQLLLIGIWTTSMSVFNGATAIHIALVVKREHRRAVRRIASGSTLQPLMMSHRHSASESSNSSQVSDAPTVQQTRKVWWWILACEW